MADFGLRLVSTGYVIAIFSGMADIAGMGSQPLPGVPYFGPWQATGVLIGEIVIAHRIPDADTVSQAGCSQRVEPAPNRSIHAEHENETRRNGGFFVD